MKRLTILLLCFVLTGCSQLFIRNQKVQFDIKDTYFDNTTLEIQTILNKQLTSFNEHLTLSDFKLKQVNGDYYTHDAKINDSLSLELESDDVATKVYRITIQVSLNANQQDALVDAGYLYDIIMHQATKQHVSSSYMTLLYDFLKNPSSPATLPIEVIENGILYQAYYHQNTVYLVLEKTTENDIITNDWQAMHLNISQDTPRSLITKISLNTYDSIKEGMTYEEVVSIIGAEGTLVFEPSSPDDDYVSKIYTWLGNGNLGSNASLTFENNKMTSKTQHGLK